MTERLDKFLAHAGFGTRTEVKKLIRQKRVQVDGDIPKNGDGKIDPEKQTICVDGKEVSSQKQEYILLHKPSGCVTATKDNRDTTVMDLIASPVKDRLFPVGRLDKDTEGLLLITDDGPLAHQLLSPKKHVPKTYYARVSGILPEQAARRFAEGLDIGDEKPTLPAELKILKNDPEGESSEIELTIHEGRFHQVKRMCHAVGCEVTYLRRISMGSLKLDDSLEKGAYRKLTSQEIEELINFQKQ